MRRFDIKNNIMVGREENKETSMDVLIRKGIKPTRQRIEIADVLFEKRTHLSADQVFLAANRVNLKTSKATVHNTLKLFVDTGLINRVIVDPERVFYDSNTEPHYHIYDTESDSLTDVSTDKIVLLKSPSVPKGLVVDGIDIIIRIKSLRKGNQ